MISEEMKKLDAAGLKEREADLRKQLFDLKTRNSSEKVKDTSQFRKIKKDIARLLTLQTQRVPAGPQDTQAAAQ